MPETFSMFRTPTNYPQCWQSDGRYAKGGHGLRVQSVGLVTCELVDIVRTT